MKFLISVVARKCKNLLGSEKLQNGVYSPNKKEYSFGDIVSFSCNAGFELRGSKLLSCKISGLWSSVSWPRCFRKYPFEYFLLFYCN